MACGTGKTFTSLRIIEETTPKSGNILFLAPSIGLISQTLREYAYERKEAQEYIAVCSDKKAGKDSEEMDINDLKISPTTDAKKIAEQLKGRSQKRTIVFSTYQSLKKIKEAQKHGAPKFDLVICDEAHRTTGVESSETKEGNYFTLINNKDYVKASKRLYMTATPRIYKENIKKKAEKTYKADIHSMDDEKVFGKEIYRLEFSEAINRNLLSDYKVIILSIDQKYMSDRLQDVLLKDTNLCLDDASRLIGCYKALRDQGKKEGTKLSRAVGFLRDIKSSKNAAKEFQNVVDALGDYENDKFTCKTDHIDGTDNSITRIKKLDWLKQDAGCTEDNEKICRILMNAKCLTEGIDVPNLDAVMFLHPRKSQVDVVQAVGRVIRKQEGKKYGYVILPVVIPAGKTPEDALNDNKTYRVVWQVLNALRSHDSEFNAEVNNLNLNQNKSKKIELVGIGKGSAEKSESDTTADETSSEQMRLNLEANIEDIEHKIYAKIVEKCGDILYEDKWIQGVKETCETISTRIKSLLETKPGIKKEFKNYVSGLKSSINDDISEKEAISMLSEHLVTKPAFDKIFADYQFSENNPVSKSMKNVLDKLDQYNFRAELKDLEEFYRGISRRLERIDNSEGRQTVIKELYENFIKIAFPKMAEKLGVAYTPVEIVDFILESTNEILKKEFKKSLTDKGVHVMDPFTGTGTFINRLISNKNLIKKEDLPRKFSEELHANEIMLLPYYVASINIESAYNSRIGGRFKQFPGMTLTDTFNCYNQNDFNFKDNVLPLFKENKKRIKNQEEAVIQVIVGNPPYSVGQKSENDANKNTVHPSLHKNIEKTYVKESDSTFRGALYDSYIKSIRWATDRLGDKGGVIGFVHNASLVNERSISGLRKSLVKEFDSIYCFNLRGNARTKGEKRRKEKDNVFGQSSRTPIAITFLVKNSKKQNAKTQIKYNDIGDYLSREEKLKIIKDFKSVDGIEKQNKWKNIAPDKHGDWLNQRDESFYKFLPMGDKKDKNSNDIFSLYSCGVKTNRDSWVYNFDKQKVENNMKSMVDFYDQELDRLKDKELNSKTIDKFINRDNLKIKWTHRVKEKLIKKQSLKFKSHYIKPSSYRPFTKSWVYFDPVFNERQYQLPKIFKKEDIENKVICVSGVGANTFSALITDAIPSLDFINKTQCFPLYWFDKDGRKKDGITDDTLKKFRNFYKIKSISKEDIFYYIYGLLHSEDYRTRYKSNLDKSLPYIPLVSDFYQFSKKGRSLADLHLNYEDQKSSKGIKILKNGKEVQISELKKADLTIKKMKINKKDKSKIIFNDCITVSNIPKEAWDYKINGWSAPKWVMERYRHKVDKKAQIENDPNSYSSDSKYILKLLLSVITVSLKTQELVQSLPPIDFKKAIPDTPTPDPKAA